MSFEKVTAYLESLVQRELPSCDLMVMQGHHVLYRHTCGWRDAAHSQPLDGTETYCLYSCTKPVTICAALQLVEAGKLALDAPVARYLPAWGSLRVRSGDGLRPAGRTLTVRHLMSMQSGLDYQLDPAWREAHAQADTLEFVQALAEKPLLFEPGTDYCYGLSHDVLAAVMEAVTGQRFSAYVKEHIFAPLGITALTFDTVQAQTGHPCAQYYCHGTDAPLEACAPLENPYRYTPHYESGGAGLMGMVADYMRFADAVACGGTDAQGHRLLNRETIDLWRTPQLCAKAKQTFDATARKLGYSYGLGVRTRVDTSIGRGGPLGEFGWSGAAGSYVIMDPAHELSCFLALHVRGCAQLGSIVHPHMQTLLYEALGL